MVMISVNSKILTYLEKPAPIYLRKAVEVKKEPVQTPVDHSELSLQLSPVCFKTSPKANPQVEKPSKVKVVAGWRLSFF